MNINTAMQTHLDEGGLLELVVQRNGKCVLDFLPNPTVIEQLKAKLESE